LVLSSVIDEGDALTLVPESREVPPAAFLALILVGRHQWCGRDGDTERSLASGCGCRSFRRHRAVWCHVVLADCAAPLRGRYLRRVNPRRVALSRLRVQVDAVLPPLATCRSIVGRLASFGPIHRARRPSRAPSRSAKDAPSIGLNIGDWTNCGEVYETEDHRFKSCRARWLTNPSRSVEPPIAGHASKQAKAAGDRLRSDQPVARLSRTR
jgi:hypothetical protein